VPTETETSGGVSQDQPGQEDTDRSSPEISHQDRGPTGTVLSGAPITEKPGDKIGRYKLLEQIGEGGFGVVYMAEQREPLRRRVALKIIKLGMDTRQVVARFEAERQALALMDHPNIAKVHDAGATETGRPYFVMELVHGIKITEYCDQHQLSTHQRLELFMQVCHAIQHAHQKGIIHRDIKPSNILVTLHDGVSVPKVIDFGIAKATAGQELTDKTIFTQFQQFIGTPAYMSPEQAQMSGLDVDTRSDIYSLGVLLYELLVGKTPFDSKELLAAGLEEMRRAIREKEPMRPSTRVSSMVAEEQTTTAKRHGADAPKLINLLRGDLDWIAMKCLEKDRTRRYETANGLARDIERHLNSEPVVARPPSTVYRFQKFVRRNKVMVTAAATVAMVLVLGIFVSTWQAVRAMRAESTARTEAKRADQNAATATLNADKAKAAANDLRRSLYVADMKMAHVALEEYNLGRARELLQKYLTESNPRQTASLSPTGGHSTSAEESRGFEWYYLWQRSRGQEEFSIRAHDKGVSCVAFSPNGQIFATAGGDLSVKVWETASRQLLKTFPGFGRTSDATGLAPNSICFSPDGKLLAAADKDSIVVWETVEWREQARIPRESPSDMNMVGLPVVFSPDGNTLAGAAAHAVQFWDRHTWRPLPSVACEAAVRSLSISYSDDGRFLALGFPNGGRPSPRTEVWDSAAHIKQGEFAQRRIGLLRFSPVNGLLTAGDYEGTVVMWDPVKSQVVTRWNAHVSAVRGLTFSRDGKVLVTCGDDQVICFWEAAGRPPKLLTRLLGHLNRIWAIDLSPDGRTLISASADGTVKFWSASYQGQGDELKQAVTPLWFSADGRILGTIDTNAVIRSWDVAARRQIDSVTLASNNDVISADGQACVLRGTHGAIELWNLEKRERITTLPEDEQTDVHALLLSPNHRRFASAHMARDSGHSSEARVWNWPTGQIEARFPISDMRLAFSWDGTILATLGTNSTIRIWDLTSRGELKSLAYPYYIYCLSFSPDGKFLAAGAGDMVARIWEISSAKLVAELHGHKGALWALAFSADGKTLATGSSDKTVKFWNVPTWQELMTVPGYGKLASHLMFSPDGTTLAVGSYSQDNEPGPLQIWRAVPATEASLSGDSKP
jgi:WD40 repeat protein/serine/threonine protein kinase